MQLKLLMFAGLAERFGGPVIDLALPYESVTPGQLKAYLSEMNPQASSVVALSFVAVNQEYAEEGQVIREGDEVALIPPVSGGENPLVQITREPIRIEEVTAKVLHPNHGAALTFTGTTREFTNGKRTTLLEYDAYEPMALKTMHQICMEISERWPGTLSAITHRIGPVAAGQISVVIAVSSPHRDAAYEASRYAIERLKQIVPIWKKEVWEDGSEWKGHQLGPWDPTAPHSDNACSLNSNKAGGQHP